MNEITRAKNKAGRHVLLRAVRACKWNLSRAAKQLGLGKCSDVVRYLRILAPVEYQAAREAGLIRHGGDMRRARRA